MSNPISGDNILSALDVKSSQSERRKQDASAPDRAQTENPAATPNTADSLQLTHSQANAETRPLSETLSSSEQAQEALQKLLANIQNSPEQTMSAQAQVQQFQADALLSASTA